MARVQDTASFIAAAIAVHGDRYDYSQTDYVGANMPIQIICKTHGLFTLGWAASHYGEKGSGCQKCSGCEVKVKDTASFIARSLALYGDKYDYSKTVYYGSNKPILIICKTCGPFLLAESSSHFRSMCGCRTCGIKEALKSRGAIKYCAECGCWCKYGGKRLLRRIVCTDCKTRILTTEDHAWNVWSKVEANRFLKYERKKEKLLGWRMFAAKKVKNMRINRFRYIHTKNANESKILASWDDWSRYQCNSRLRKGETEWQRKARSWAQGLTTLYRKKQAEQSC